MKQILLRAVGVLVVCGCFSWAAYYFLGPAALVLSLPLFGVLISRVFIDFVDEMRMVAKHVALRSVQGSYYSFQGISVNVVEDDDYCQWVAADEVRKIVGSGATDRMLALAYPDGWCEMGKPPKGYLRDDALLLYLAKENSLRGVKFRVWVERNIAHQAKKQRERFGIRVSDPRAPDLQPNHLGDTMVPRDMQSTLPQS
ncbi:MAG: hypothetical protein H7Y28_00595 [Rhodoferax sp.]|nr:hypothetical protein [Rhodoferax sp.]